MPADGYADATIKGTAADRRWTPIIAIGAVVLFALAAFRARFGASLFDDTYYVTAALRAVGGARPFVGEISLQAQGQWAAMPFVWLWRQAFGLTGIMLAVRVYYVVLASACAVVAYRLLRPSFHPVATAALAVPLLAPPYLLLAPTYNTTAALAFTLAVAFGWAALRDRSARHAFAFGRAIVIGSVSYIALVTMAGVLLATFVWRAREPRLARAALAGTAVSGTVVALAMFAGVPLDALRSSLAFASARARGWGRR